MSAPKSFFNRSADQQVARTGSNPNKFSVINQLKTLCLTQSFSKNIIFCADTLSVIAIIGYQLSILNAFVKCVSAVYFNLISFPCRGRLRYNTTVMFYFIVMLLLGETSCDTDFNYSLLIQPPFPLTQPCQQLPSTCVTSDDNEENYCSIFNETSQTWNLQVAVILPDNPNYIINLNKVNIIFCLFNT